MKRTTRFRWRAIRSSTPTRVRFNYQSMVTPSSVYDYGMDTRERTLLKQQEVLGGYDPAQYQAKRVWAVARDGTKVPMSMVYRKGIAARWQGAAAALRLRIVRRVDVADVLVQPAEPARPRRHLRHRLHPWRRRDGRGVARAGPHDAEDEHVHRLHRLRGVPGQEPLHVHRPAGHSGRQRRRPAGRRRRQHAARPVQGRRRAGAVRRRHQHHARRHPAAHDQRVHRVGQSEREARRSTT